MSSGLRIRSVRLEMLTLCIWDPSLHPTSAMCVYYVCICRDICVSSVMYVPQDMCDFLPSSKQVLLVDLPCRYQASWPQSFWGIFWIYLCLHGHAGTVDYATTPGFPWLLGIQTPVLSFPDSPWVTSSAQINEGQVENVGTFTSHS